MLLHYAFYQKPDVLDWGADGSQRRADESGKGDVIESDDGYVFRDPFAGILERGDDPNGGTVIPGEDGIEDQLVLQPALDYLTGDVLVKTAITDQFLIERKAVGLKG